jgi:hypothetical protein
VASDQPNRSGDRPKQRRVAAVELASWSEPATRTTAPDKRGYARVVAGDDASQRESEGRPIPLRTLEGWFWFPPASERAFGTIEIRPRDLRLTLRDSAHPQDARDDVVVIHGDSLDGKHLSVLDAFATSRRDFISYGHNVEQFRFNTLLIGAHVMDESELVFARGIVHLRGLREWLSASWGGRAPYAFRTLVAPPPRGLRERFAAWREGRRRGADPDTMPHPLEVTVAGATLKFGYERSAGGTHFQDVINYDAAVDVDLDQPRPLDEWREQWLRPLLDLLVFGTREQVVVDQFKAIIDERRLAWLLGPAVRRALPDRVWARHDVEVVRPHVVDIRPRGIRPFSTCCYRSGRSAARRRRGWLSTSTSTAPLAAPRPSCSSC